MPADTPKSCPACGSDDVFCVDRVKMPDYFKCRKCNESGAAECRWMENEVAWLRRSLSDALGEVERLRTALVAAQAEFATLGQALGEFTNPATVDVMNLIDSALTTQEAKT